MTIESDPLYWPPRLEELRTLSGHLLFSRNSTESTLGVPGPLGQVDTWDSVIHLPPLVLVCAMEGMGLRSDIMGHPTVKSWPWATVQSGR